MARDCTICAHPRRHEIEAAMVHGHSSRRIAADYGLAYGAIHRHRNNHLPAAIRQAAAAALERADEDAGEALPRIDTMPVHGTASAAPAAAPIVTTETLSPVPSIRRRQRALQLSDSPPAPPVAPADATIAPASTSPGAGVFNVYQSATDLRERAMRLLEGAERAGDTKTALMAIREARGVLEHLSRLEERHQASTTHAPLDTSPEWIRTRTAIVAALADFPEARIAVAEALVGVGALH
ncbi:hypothetical protein GOD78_10985 [Sinorhizobium medicae]|nr:hypothetical protein [Sinorhizobium medicae]MDX0818042.1 hypothetical protein [Sinorhizobium medicae]